VLETWSGVAVIAAPRIGGLPVGALARDAVCALETAVNLGAGLARGRAAVFARQPVEALDDPEARQAAGRAARVELFHQVLGRQADVVHARRIGMRAHVGFDEDAAVRRFVTSPAEGFPQVIPIGNPFAQVRIIFMLRAHHQKVFGKSGLAGEGLGFFPIRREHMGEIGLALRHADDFKVKLVVYPDQEFHVPGKHSQHRVRPERAFAREAERQPRKLHANARLVARRVELRARTRDVARECAEQVGIVARHPLHPAAERGPQHGGDHALLAVLGEQCNTSSAVHVRHINLGRDFASIQFHHDRVLKSASQLGRKGPVKIEETDDEDQRAHPYQQRPRMEFLA